MNLSPKKTKSLVVSWSRTCAFGYSDFILGGAELEKLTSLRILGATFYFKLTPKTHLREVVSKAARSHGVVLRARKLFDCPRVPKSYFNAYILPNLEHCAPV